MGKKRSKDRRRCYREWPGYSPLTRREAYEVLARFQHDGTFGARIYEALEKLRIRRTAEAMGMTEEVLKPSSMRKILARRFGKDPSWVLFRLANSIDQPGIQEDCSE